MVREAIQCEFESHYRHAGDMPDGTLLVAEFMTPTTSVAWGAALTEILVNQSSAKRQD